MKQNLFIVILILTLSCKEKNTIESSDLSRGDTLAAAQPRMPQSNVMNEERPRPALIMETEEIKIYGDTTIEKEKIYLAWVKFKPYILFEDFAVEIDTTQKATLDLNSHEGAKMFRTRIRKGYESKAANFAGHYTFVFWGCGSPCQMGVIVDRNTGKIYDAPTATRGYDFKPGSRLLIVNPPDEDGYYETPCGWCTPLVYVFDEQTKEFIEKKG